MNKKYPNLIPWGHSRQITLYRTKTKIKVIKIETRYKLTYINLGMTSCRKEMNLKERNWGSFHKSIINTSYKDETKCNKSILSFIQKSLRTSQVTIYRVIYRERP